MNAITKAATKKTTDDGILVNAITPGSIDAPLTDSFGDAQKVEYRQAHAGGATFPREIVDTFGRPTAERSRRPNSGRTCSKADEGN